MNSWQTASWLEEESDTSYYAPDADALLSDSFLDSYCLRVQEGEGEAEGLIGLAFEPVERHPDRIDIQGVMWLEPASSELQWLEFRYADLDADVRSPLLGGKVAFTALPNGTWVVREWYIRTPRAGGRPNPSANIPQRFLAGIRETGALVMRIIAPEGETFVEFETGVVEGVVLDSLNAGPLEGARVFASGTDHSAVTGSDGRYRLDGLTDGIHRIAYEHPALEEVGYAPEPVEVEIRRGEIAWLRLLAPSPREVLRAACAEEDALLWHLIAHLVDLPAVLAGRVVDPASGVPVAGATVTAIWTGWDVDSYGPGTSFNPLDPVGGLTTVGERHGQYQDATGADGRFLFCRVPVGPGVVVVATTASGAVQQGIVLEVEGQTEFMTVYLLKLVWYH